MKQQMESRTRRKHIKGIPVANRQGWAGEVLTTVLKSAWNNLPGKVKYCEDKLCVYFAKIFHI